MYLWRFRNVFRSITLNAIEMTATEASERLGRGSGVVCRGAGVSAGV
jgi:hypothetical protein